MKKIAETERLLLRELLASDELGMFDLDSDPEVHKYLGNNPVESLDEIREVIKFIQKQYEENGVGRWAVIRKSDNEFLGWAGIKYFKTPINNHVNFYELGYRFQQKYWGMGYATEAAKACIAYAFDQMQLNEVIAMTDVDNENSKKVLLKSGFKLIETFDDNGEQTNWFSIQKSDHQK